MPEPKILLVEDELSLAEGIKLNLELEGLGCTWIPRGDQALRQILAETYDLVILDVMLPGMDGYTICQKVREAKNHTPILFLTAKNTDDDRVHGFETGGDDYLGKPFQVKELLLRIRAILRRATTEVPEGVAPVQTFGRLRVDSEAHRVWVDEVEARLTALEFRLLTTFLARKGRVQTREVLLSDVWGIQADVTTRTVDTHVKRLREKLEAAGEYLETVRGVGYRWRTAPDAADEGE